MSQSCFSRIPEADSAEVWGILAVASDPFEVNDQSAELVRQAYVKSRRTPNDIRILYSALPHIQNGYLLVHFEDKGKIKILTPRAILNAILPKAVRRQRYQLEQACDDFLEYPCDPQTLIEFKSKYRQMVELAKDLQTELKRNVQVESGDICKDFEYLDKNIYHRFSEYEYEKARKILFKSCNDV